MIDIERPRCTCCSEDWGVLPHRHIPIIHGAQVATMKDMEVSNPWG